MFFADPAAAFAHIGRALRPGGRLAWRVWQRHERDEWSVAVRRARTPEAARSAGTLATCSLGDPAVATELLDLRRFHLNRLRRGA